ncbi:ATP-binding protein, partial [bacterium]|nr:ATP-binding protein [bacterium]
MQLNLFRRIDDLIHGSSVNSSRTFSITLVFDPEDISAGEEIQYEVEVGSDEDGLPEIEYEYLSAIKRDETFETIRTKGETRQMRVNLELIRMPSGRQEEEEEETDIENELSEEDEQDYVPPIYQEETIEPDEEVEIVELDEEVSDAEELYEIEVLEEVKPSNKYKWVPTTDSNKLALDVVERTEDLGGYKLKVFLERAVFLRLNPHSIASFTPPRLKHSPRLLDDEGTRLAALLGELDEESLEILVEKLSFIIQGANSLVPHEPAGPADRRYFTFSETINGEESMLEIPAWVLSEGTRRVTAILAVLLHDQPPPLLCIEEIENGLDPWTIKYVLEELTGAVERGTQVILTTHSPYLLNLFPPDNIL